MLGGMAPVASGRLPGVFDIDFHPLSSNTSRNIAMKLAEFGGANSAFNMCETFLLIVEPSKIGGLKFPIFFKRVDDRFIWKFHRYKYRNVN